jgi:hypothetical protein
VDYKYKQLGENNYQKRGWQFFSKLRNSLQSTNTVYSATLVTDLDISGYIPLGRFYFVPRVFYSRAQVTDKKETDEARLREIFEVQCASSEADNSVCEDLKNKISRNLSRHNRYGTASALGGISQLRSESILRYKGSQTQYQAMEVRYLFEAGKFLMEPLLFWERGSSFDEEVEEQERDFVVSRGLEYRIHLTKELVYKIVYAESDRNKAWQLSVASPW